MRTAAQRRVSLVVTSNYAPDDLLPNPLWHDHFLPTIEAIKDMMDVVEWVIDDVPSPAVGDAASAPAWQRFSNVVDVLYDQDITLFLIGNGPLDWDIEPNGNALPVDLARIASRLSPLSRSHPDQALEREEAAGR